MSVEEVSAGILRAAPRTWPKHYGFRLERQEGGPLVLIGYTRHEKLQDEVSQVLVMIDHPTPYNLLASLLWNS